MSWSPLSPGVDTSYPTLEHLDAQQQWLAHIDRRPDQSPLNSLGRAV